MHNPHANFFKISNEDSNNINQKNGSNIVIINGDSNQTVDPIKNKINGIQKDNIRN